MNASGKVEAAPDRAALQIGVETQASNAKDALAQNAERLRRVIDALRKAGVSEDDLQTSQVSLWPRDARATAPRSPATAPRTPSPSSSTSRRRAPRSTRRSRPARTSSPGPTLSVDERDELYRKALADAVEAARAKAEAIADAAGVNVGRVTAVVESAGYERPPMPYARRPPATQAAASTPIEPGKQEIEATVTVTFAVA